VRLAPACAAFALLLSTLAAQESGRVFGKHSYTLHDLNAPAAVAISKDGRLYVLESGAHRIAAFEKDSSLHKRFGARGSELGEFEAPQAIAVSADGRVFVADTGNHRVQIFAADGRALMEFGGRGAAPGRMHSPLGIATSGELLAVADSGNRRVQLFNLEGELQHVLDPEEPFHRPTDVTIGAGQIFVADADQHHVRSFTPAGEEVTRFGDWGFFPGLFSDLSGLDFHAGKLYASDAENHRVQVFEPDGELIYKWGLHAIRPREGRGKLHYPSDVAVAPNGLFVALAEPSDDRVQVFVHADGDEPDADVLRRDIVAPSAHYGHAFHAAGQWMVVVEPETHTLLVFDTRWDLPRLIGRVGGYGRTAGTFVRPTGVHLDAETRTLLVCDTGNRRLQALHLDIDPQAEAGFDREMPRFLRMVDFERFGRTILDLELEWTIEPIAVTRDEAGAVYVLDGRNERVFVFNERLRPQRSFGALSAPTSLVATDGKVFVVDSRGVQVFTAAGDALHSFGADALHTPHGIVLGPDGTLYVSDVAAHRLVHFDKSGNELGVIGQRGIERNQFYKPRALTFDGNGQLNVLDHGNHRIQWFDETNAYAGVFGSRLYTRPARVPGSWEEPAHD
jgi:tripartite motif-containing protein 71